MKSAVVCCSVLQCAAVNCSLLQCAAVRCSVLQCAAVCCSALQRVAVRCSVLQCVAVYCSALQYVAVCSSMLQRATSVLQYVAVTICSHATHTVHNIGRTRNKHSAQHWTHICEQRVVHNIGRTRAKNCLFECALTNKICFCSHMCTRLDAHA